MLRTFFWISLLMMHFSGLAQDKDSKVELGVATDNDWFVYHMGSDRYYSFGIDINLKFRSERKSLSKLNSLGYFFDISIVQQGYTPEYTLNGVRDNRPFAGWLFFKAKEVHAFEKNVLKFGFEVGILGPSAKAGEVQNQFHKLIGSDLVDGWERQIPDHPGINVTLEYITEVLGDRIWDILADGSVSIGTVHTFLNPSLLLRLGKLNPYQRSLATLSSIQAKSSEMEFYFSFGAGFKYLLYDATLMGGLREKEYFLIRKDINQLRLMGEFAINYSFNKWSASLSYFYSSREFDGAESHRYGRLEILRRI